MKIYDLIVENVNLLFFLAWSCCTVCFNFINKNSRWWCIDILFFDVLTAITKLVVLSSFFSSQPLLELGFCGDGLLVF